MKNRNRATMKGRTETNKKSGNKMEVEIDNKENAI